MNVINFIHINQAKNKNPHGLENEILVKYYRKLELHIYTVKK